MKKEENIELRPINVKTAYITIEGDGDLILNQMNARTIRTLTAERNDKKLTKEVVNMWEDLITSIRWEKPIGVADTYTECDHDLYNKLMIENRPCISAFGLKKSFDQAVVRNEIDTYATKFDNAVNVVATNNDIPIKFAAYGYEEKLMSPKKGSPVLVRLNHFSTWSAEFMIQYTDNVYSLEQIVNIINLAGFGLGIGSGRTSGYGRYHVTGIR